MSWERAGPHGGVDVRESQLLTQQLGAQGREPSASLAAVAEGAPEDCVAAGRGLVSSIAICLGVGRRDPELLEVADCVFDGTRRGGVGAPEAEESHVVSRFAGTAKS